MGKGPHGDVITQGKKDMEERTISRGDNMGR